MASRQEQDDVRKSPPKYEIFNFYYSLVNLLLLAIIIFTYINALLG